MDADGRLNLSPDGEFQPVAVDFHNVLRTFTKSYVRNIGAKNEMILCKMTFVTLKIVFVLFLQIQIDRAL